MSDNQFPDPISILNSPLTPTFPLVSTGWQPSYPGVNQPPLLTFHCDGRVTVSDKLKPEETAKLVLDQIKIQWMKDAQATKIRELQDWKESALAVEREWNANAIATMLGGKPGESQRKVIQREVPRLLDRIKRLEDAGDAANDRVKELDEKRLEVAARNLSNMLHVDGLHRKIERLIKAGDGLRAVVARDYPRTEFCDEWTKAKEAKP